MNDELSVGNIAAIVDRQAARRPAAPAVLMPDRVIGYRELSGMVHAVSRMLLDGGVRPGQTIGISMAQTPQHLVTLFALARIGAVSVPVHAMLPRDRRLLAARRYGVAAIVSARPELRLEELPFIDLANAGIGGAAAVVPIYEAAPDYPFRIALSSGTSGDPKGVMYSHGYMLDRIRKTNHACTPLSRILPMDLNFTIGFVFALGMFAAGGAVIFPRSQSLDDLVMAVRACGASHWLVSPAQAEEIARLLPDDDIHFPALQHLRVVGTAPGARLIRIIKQRFSPNVYVPYGSTEMGVVSMATPEILDRFPDSAGYLSSWIRAEVVDDHDQQLAPGQSGRLRLQAEGMVGGYHMAPAHTAKHFRNGWFYPGDCGRISADGLLFIEGREDDVINIGGLKINPHDVEAVLQSHPAVREAAVFALAAQPVHQEVLAAAFIATSPVSIAELQAFADERLGPTSPQRLIQLAAFPRNTTGKLMRHQLAAVVRQSQADSAVGRAR